MSIDEVLAIIRAFFEALKRIIAAFTGKEYTEETETE